MTKKTKTAVPAKKTGTDVIIEHTIKSNQHLSSAEIKELLEYDMQTVSRWKRKLETLEVEVRYMKDTIASLNAAIAGLNQILDARR